MAMIPAMAAFFRRQWIYFITFGVLGSFVLSVLVVGHGKYFELPFTVQRTLANLPGDWDQKVIQQTRGLFRQELRAMAIEDIKSSPWVGNNGIAVKFSEMEKFMLYAKDPTRFEAAGHAASSNWHNTWLGMAADFGIPAAAFYLGFILTFLVLGYRTIRRFPHGSHLNTLSYMLFFFLTTQALRTWTSGHSALSPYQIWWVAGLIAALSLTRQASDKDTEGNIGQEGDPPLQKAQAIPGQSESAKSP
jgi:O-antigen ligase